MARSQVSSRSHATLAPNCVSTFSLEKYVNKKSFATHCLADRPDIDKDQ